MVELIQITDKEVILFQIQVTAFDIFIHLRSEIEWANVGIRRLIIVSVEHKCQVQLQVGVVSS